MKYLPKEETDPQGFVNAITEANPQDGSIEKKESYSALMDKKPLRQFLLTEQHFLCLYCQSQIDMKTSQTEHYLSQANYSKLSLRYSNLYAGCECNELKRVTKSEDRRELRNDFCGHRKGDTELTWSPVKDPIAVATTTSCNPFFEVNTERGSINGKGQNTAEVNDFIRVCNLNHKLLKRARSEAFKTITESGLTLDEMIRRVAANPSQPYNQFILNGLII